MQIQSCVNIINKIVLTKKANKKNSVNLGKSSKQLLSFQYYLTFIQIDSLYCQVDTFFTHRYI